MKQRHACGRYARVIWTGFGRSLVLCPSCDRHARKTNQLQRERIEREQFNELLDSFGVAAE